MKVPESGHLKSGLAVRRAVYHVSGVMHGRTKPYWQLCTQTIKMGRICGWQLVAVMTARLSLLPSAQLGSVGWHV